MRLNPFGILREQFLKSRETRLFQELSPREVFTFIHETNKWGDPQSRSGKGSNLERTAELRRRLPGLLEELGARSLVDVPCGDFFWMREVDLGPCAYVGCDIVESLIAENERRYSDERRAFVLLDLLEERPPRGDVLLCRDCLVHLSHARALRALANLKASGSPCLLTTHYPDLRRNRDIVTGKHRPLNLTLEPFRLPEPRTWIEEGSLNRRMGRKCLGLWRLADLP